jgi:ATP-dependent RNA helicase DDX52/ROK1
MDSLFASLAPGTRFNRQKYAQDVALFQQPAPERTIKSKELDFFGDRSVDKPQEPADEVPPQVGKPKPTVVRGKVNVKVTGTDISPPLSFSQLSEKTPLWIVKNLSDMGYSDLTPIQSHAIPISLSQREVLACAPTGSGKTMAYLIPLFAKLDSPGKKRKEKGFRAVIIAPTRELSQQIYREAQRLSNGVKFKVCDLTRIKNPDAIDSKQFQNYDLLISTPMRLVHCLTHDLIELGNVQHLILDEADRLLDMGFAEQVDSILTHLPHEKLVKSLYSATFPSNVEQLANTFMTDAIRIIVGLKNTATSSIDQKLVYVGDEGGKLLEIRNMVQQGAFKPPVLIFVQSIDRAKELFNELVYDGINVDVMHSDRTRQQRDDIVVNFRTGKIWVLICTELLSRGIDFKGVNLVINYDFPQSTASYIHRIGRTGRAGKDGTAVTFFTKEDGIYLKAIVQVVKDSGCHVPDWMLSLEKPSKLLRKMLKQTPARSAISTASSFDSRKRKHRQDVIENSKKKQKETVQSASLIDFDAAKDGPHKHKA